jgi:hypothetical protein
MIGPDFGYKKKAYQGKPASLNVSFTTLNFRQQLIVFPGLEKDFATTNIAFVCLS